MTKQARTDIPFQLMPEDKERVAIAQRVLDSSKYGQLIPINTGAQCIYCVVPWGKAKTLRGVLIERAVKPATPRAERNLEKGYGLRNGIENLAQLPEAREHHIVGLYDYFDLMDKEGFTMSVIDHIEGDTVQDRAPLTKSELKIMGECLFDSVKYYTARGKLHRDINPRNIVLTRGANLEAKLLDWGIACDQDKVEPKALPTSGNHLAIDPLVHFEGKTYDLCSEMYQIAELIHFAKTGKHIVDYDLDNKRGNSVDCATGGLVDTEGKLIKYRHESAVKMATKKLPRRLGNLIRNGMTLNPANNFSESNTFIDKYLTGPARKVVRRAKRIVNPSPESVYVRDKSFISESINRLKRVFEYEPRRYNSVDDFIKDFDKAMKPGILERMASRWKSLTAIGAAVALAAGALTYGIVQKKDSLERAIDEFREDGKKITLSVDQNGRGLVVDNNIVDLQEPNIFIYGRGKDYVSYPNQNKIIEARKGEELDVHVPLKEKPWKKELREHGLSLPSFRGRVYLEGYEPKEFSAQAESFNEAYSYDFGGPSPGYVKYKIPADIKDGVHNLVIEIDPPLKNKSAQYKSAVDALKIPNPDQVINRKLIPIVIGNVAEQIKFYEAEINGYANKIKFNHIQGNYDNKMPTNLTYRSSIEGRLDQEFTNKSYFASNMQDIGIRFPTETNMETRALGVVARNDKGEPVYSTFVPVRCVDIVDRKSDPNMKPIFWYELGIPKTNYWQEVKRLKEKMYLGK